MKVIGLTGGIGMGKSACARLLSARGIPVIDTDDLARRVVEPRQPALTEIVERFGPEVLDEAGVLRRDKLAEKIFGDTAARRQLEDILHPRIRELWRQQVALWKQRDFCCGVVEIPLLFETGAEKEVDVTICVACSSATQSVRLSERGWGGEEISKRIAAQLPIETKIARSDYVIWAEGSLEVHAAQLDTILLQLCGGDVFARRRL